MNVDITTILIGLLSGSGILGVWLNNRSQSEQNKINAKMAMEKAVDDKGNQLMTQLMEANQRDRDEYERMRKEWAEERIRILTKLDACESHRIDDAKERAKDAAERATLREQMAHMRGKLEGLPMMPIDVIGKKVEPTGGPT